MKREANFGIKFRYWLKANSHLFSGSTAFELKQTNLNYLAFNYVAPHQIDGLLAATFEGLIYKAPDDSRGVKPFDYFYLKNAAAYIVIRYPDFFCLIPIHKFITEKENSPRSSLTSERAKELAWRVIPT